MGEGCGECEEGGGGGAPRCGEGVEGGGEESEGAGQNSRGDFGSRFRVLDLGFREEVKGQVKAAEVIRAHDLGFWI